MLGWRRSGQQLREQAFGYSNVAGSVASACLRDNEPSDRDDGESDHEHWQSAVGATR